MTPLQFTSFRDRLESASGFQSAQFREVEAVLGRRDASAAAAQPEGSAARARIEAAQGRRSVWGSFLRFLAARGHALAEDVLARDVTLAAGSPTSASRTSSSPSIATTPTRRSSRSGWSTSTRASRSGATAT